MSDCPTDLPPDYFIDYLDNCSRDKKIQMIYEYVDRHLLKCRVPTISLLLQLAVKITDNQIAAAFLFATYETRLLLSEERRNLVESITNRMKAIGESDKVDNLLGEWAK